VEARESCLDSVRSFSLGVFVFAHLKKFKSIIVSGPQRSGTRICAKMIAYDTGYQYIDEVYIKIDSEDLLNKYLVKGEVVVQCPALAHIVHKYNNDIAIIFMRRDIKDILASQKRVGWSTRPEERELKKYNKKGIISKIKYDYWEDYQKSKIKNFFEVDYKSLSTHPLWKTKKERKDYHSDQTREKIG